MSLRFRDNLGDWKFLLTSGVSVFKFSTLERKFYTFQSEIVIKKKYEMLTHFFCLFRQTSGPPESPLQLPLFIFSFPAHNIFLFINDTPFGSLFFFAQIVLLTTVNWTSRSLLLSTSPDSFLPQP